MKSSQPIPFWLLDRLGLDPALNGDIAEEWARGHSSIWYWRQILSAVRAAIWDGTLWHKMLAVRAVLTGCAMNYALTVALQHLPAVYIPPKAWIATWAIGLALMLLMQAVTGWVVARTHRARPVPMVTAFAIFLMLWAIVLGIADSHLKMLLVDSLDQPRFRPYLFRYLASISTAILAHLLGLYTGGILGAGGKVSLSDRAQQ